MKSLRNIVFIFITGIFITTTSCEKKYPDGPLLNFHSKKSRVVGYWDVESFTVDGIDSTAYLKSQPNYGWYIFYSESEFGGNDQYSFQCGTSISGYWKFANKKNDLFIHLYYYNGGAVGPYGANDVTWEIRRLETRELWLKTTYNGKIYFIKFNHKTI